MNDNNTNNNAAKNMKKNLVPVTDWIDAAEAKAKKAELIANGTYAKGQVTLSSYRWKDIKDHSKGYIARVMVDAEVAKAEDVVAKKVAKKKLKKSENVTTSGNSDCNALKLNYFCKRNKIDTDTTTA
jgi:heat shock protein HslJ